MALASSDSSSSTTLPAIHTVTPHKKTPIGAIVGGVIGGLAVIAIALIAACLLFKRKRPTTSRDPQAAQVQQVYAKHDSGMPTSPSVGAASPPPVYSNAPGGYYTPTDPSKGQTYHPQYAGAQQPMGPPPGVAQQPMGPPPGVAQPPMGPPPGMQYANVAPPMGAPPGHQPSSPETGYAAPAELPGNTHMGANPHGQQSEAYELGQ